MFSFDLTHQIISVTLAQTANGAPMLRCVTADGERVNLFSNARKDSLGRLYAAGYRDCFVDLQLGQMLSWSEHPIGVRMVKSGEWWEVVAIAERPVGALLDVIASPDPALYRAATIHLARRLLARPGQLVVWDTETTGTAVTDEIIQIGAVNGYGTPLLDQLIQPRRLERVAAASDVHGLTPNDVADAPTFPEVYEEIADALDDRTWLIYNAPFDIGMLDQNCIQHHLAPIRSVGGVFDALPLFADFQGEWDPDYRRFKASKLSEAVAALGIEVNEAHHALGDSQMTLALLRAMAGA